MEAKITNSCGWFCWKSERQPCTFNVVFSIAAGCSTSPEAINITPSTAPSSQNYKVGDSNSVTVSEFTSDSIYCTQSSDIVYTMSVTASPSGKSTNFITFNQNNRSVAW